MKPLQVDVIVVIVAVCVVVIIISSNVFINSFIIYLVIKISSLSSTSFILQTFSKNAKINFLKNKISFLKKIKCSLTNLSFLNKKVLNKCSPFCLSTNINPHLPRLGTKLQQGTVQLEHSREHVGRLRNVYLQGYHPRGKHLLLCQSAS